jgi:hypothetical protein
MEDVGKGEEGGKTVMLDPQYVFLPPSFLFLLD